MPDYRFLTKLAALALGLVTFAKLASLDPQGRRHAWVGLGHDVGVALLGSALWVAAMFGTAIAARHLWGVPLLRTLCVALGLSVAAAYTTNSTWVWGDSRTRWLVEKVGRGLIRAVMIGFGFAVVLYGVLGPAQVLEPR